MQQRVNEVHLKIDGEELIINDVDVIETEDGLYIEDVLLLGKTEEGEDISTPQLTFYPSKYLHKMIWKEKSLVDKVKEMVISELVADKFESLLDMYDEDEEEEDQSTPHRDDPTKNPYNKG